MKKVIYPRPRRSFCCATLCSFQILQENFQIEATAKKATEIPVGGKRSADEALGNSILYHVREKGTEGGGRYLMNDIYEAIMNTFCQKICPTSPIWWRCLKRIFVPSPSL